MVRSLNLNDLAELIILSPDNLKLYLQKGKPDIINKLVIIQINIERAKLLCFRVRV